ncbi:MAG: CpsB/CapC family capsule biosynthesis tyrosine phosphatase [Rikenellaceae bacterium]
MVDVHSHILPGVDSGALSGRAALKILSYYETLGVKKVIVTPTIGNDYPNNNAASLRERFNEFKKSYSGNIELSLAAEYTLDDSFVDHLKSGDLLTLSGKYLLIELHNTDMLIDVVDLISDIIDAGYVVVLAHPENYRHFKHTEYISLKEMGVLFQLNMLSVSGCYGKMRQANAEYLLRDSFYDFVGSNVHSYSNYTKAIRDYKVSGRIIKRIEKLKLKSNKLLDM